MSDARSLADRTATRITAAVGELLAEDGGGFVEGFVFFANFTNENGEPSWVWATMDGQRITQTLGQARIINHLAESHLKMMLTDDD